MRKFLLTLAGDVSCTKYRTLLASSFDSPVLSLLSVENYFEEGIAACARNRHINATLAGIYVLRFPLSLKLHLNSKTEKL
jgi:hypothetical protein